jgi:TonB-linked SusC/RagA family outer membrane protein
MRLAIGATLRAFLVLGGLVGGISAVAQAQQGTVAGRVTDQASGQPLVGARVTVMGTSLIAQTSADGRYTLSRVPGGQLTVRASAVGFGAASRVVTVNPGETAVVDLVLALSPYSLDEVRVTATGDQAKREVGNAISRIDAPKEVEKGNIQTLTDLLGSRTPGVEVLPGTLTGSPSRVRVRGTNSLSLNNEPVYVVDGIRIISQNRSSSVCDVGCSPPSRVNDLSPDEIESVQVAKGPSASSLYGTDAANGVIVITTKKGTAGHTHWNVYAEQGLIKDYNDYPTAYRGWRSTTLDTTTAHNSRPTNGTQCILTQVVAGICTQDSLTSFNPFNDPQTSPNALGHRQQYGVQVSGGSEAVRYFLSGEWENEVGYLKMPPFAVDTLLQVRQITAVPDEQLRPNALRRTSVRANVQANLTPRIDVQASTNFISSALRVPPTDNNTTGLLSNALGGPGNKNNGHNGYRLFTPDSMFAEAIGQDINRFIGSGTANWRPTSWLALHAVGGIDYTSRLDTDLCRRNQCINFVGTFADTLGYKQDNRTSFFQYTLDVHGTASFTLSPTLTSRTTAGVQYFKNNNNLNVAFAYNLPPTATTLTAGAVPSVAESTTISKTLGGFVEQVFGYRDRLYLTASLRADGNSAFGSNFKAVYYPKLNFSYVISEEPFFPKPRWLTSFRLRGAIGASGVQPGATDAIRFFLPTTASVNSLDNPAIIFSAIGNQGLKPERAREYEIGGDATLFDSRAYFELTYYNKRTKDALIAIQQPPGAGGPITRFENIGSIVNRGIEALGNLRLIDKPGFGWDVAVNAAYNTNFVADMGKVAAIIVSSTTQDRVGYPVNGWWQRPYTYKDLDGNGIITANEITVGDTAVFVGYANPRWEVTYTTGFDLLNKRLRIVGLFDHKSGFYQLNGTDRIRCQSRNNCRGLVDPTAPLWEQARVVALRETPSGTQWGFIEKASFVRLREASATYEFPAEWARAFRAERLSFTVAGRNLWKGTGFSGIDPEANYFEGATGVVSNFQTAPPPTYWTFRLNVGF